MRELLQDWWLRLRVPPIHTTGIRGWRYRRQLRRDLEADLRDADLWDAFMVGYQAALEGDVTSPLERKARFFQWLASREEAI